MEVLADLEGKLGTGHARVDGAAVGTHDTPLASQDEEILSYRDRGDAEATGEIGHPGPSVLLHDPRDVLLAFARKDAIWHVGGLCGHGISRVE